MPSSKEWLRQFKNDLPSGMVKVGDYIVGEMIATGSIPIDSGALRDEIQQNGVQRTSTGAEIRVKASVIPYARKQHYKKQRHPVAGGQFVRMVDLVPPGPGATGMAARYNRSIRKAIAQGKLTKVSPRWNDIMKDEMVKKRAAIILAEHIRLRRGL